MTTKKERYRIAENTLVEKFTGAQAIPAPCIFENDFLIFRAISGMMSPNKTTYGDHHPHFVPEGAELEFIGNRKLGNVKIEPASGWGWGYSYVEGTQTRVEIVPVILMGRKSRIGIISSPPCAFLAPLPLESETDAAEWYNAGYDGNMTVGRWRAALQWRGAGSKEAALAVKTRWSGLRNGIRRHALPEIPGVIFPPSSTPVENETLPPDMAEVMKAEIAELRAAMEDLKSRLALLEFQP